MSISAKDAKDAYNSAKKAIDDADDLGLETKSMHDILGLAKFELEAKNYDQVHKYSVEAAAKVNELRLRHEEAYTALSSAAASISECQRFKVDCIDAISELLEATNSFENADYQKAVEHAGNVQIFSKNALNRAAASKNLTNLIQRLYGASIRANTKEAKDLYTKGIEAYKKGNYAEALDFSKSAEAKLSELEKIIRGKGKTSE